MSEPHITLYPALTDEIRAWLIDGLRYPVLAVIAGDGSPNQSVMWFDMDESDSNAIVMNMRAGRAKQGFLRRDSRASLCFEDGLSWVSLQGTVELDEDRDRSMADVLSLARRYGTSAETFDGQERITIRLRVTRVIRYGD